MRLLLLIHSKYISIKNSVLACNFLPVGWLLLTQVYTTLIMTMSLLPVRNSLGQQWKLMSYAVQLPQLLLLSKGHQPSQLAATPHSNRIPREASRPPLLVWDESCW